MPVREEPPVAAGESDIELLRRTAEAGDRAAFETFVTRHQAAVFRHASFLTHCREDAEDVLQETFLAALKHAGQYRGDAPARSWLLSIARRSVFRRHPRAEAAASAGSAGEEDGGRTLEALAFEAGWGSSDNPETLAMLAEDRARLRLALDRLPAAERDVLLLRDWEEMSGEEAAALLGITVVAMKSRLHRARIRLAAGLRSAGKEENQP